MTVTSRGVSFCPSSNNTPSSPLYTVISKRKSSPEEKYNEELPPCIGYYSSYYPLEIDDYLKMGDISGDVYPLEKPHSLLT